ncbi:MAG: patatin-like phospholipase RssA [Rhodocyclaceae bacterium]|nr:patatin-like phospholipase RssA [Rhodocyclaceae bacterium]
MIAPRGQRIGFVLGSGSARGWAHIGALRALADAGIVPDVICGCSIGALVGAACANGDLDKLETWVRSLTRRDVIGLMDLSFNGGGLLKGDKLMAFFAKHFTDRDFEQLSTPFACLATDLATGREVWFREGSVAAAVRAAIAMPGLFTPVVRDGRLLVDGALVNPVPVSLCRAMGADIVIAVDLDSNIVGSALRKAAGSDRSGSRWGSRLLTTLGLARGSNNIPPMSTVLSASLQIMQTRIGRARLAGEPADVLLSPRLAHLAPMDYHRAEEAIAEGRAVVERMMPAITHALAV